MPPFSRQLLIACLTAMRALLYFTAGLIALLFVVQQIRGDDGAAPGQLAIFCAILAVMGWGAGRAARFFASLP